LIAEEFKSVPELKDQNIKYTIIKIIVKS